MHNRSPAQRFLSSTFLSGQRIFVLPALFALCLSGCANPTADSSASNSSDRIQVVATVGMVADLVKNVGQHHVTVTQICGSGVDPHLYRATRDDVRQIMTCDIVFYSGLMLEGKMADILARISDSKPVIAVTEQLSTDNLLQPDGSAGHVDPHVWMDVSAWQRCLTVVCDELCRSFPDHANDFQTNAQRYQQELTKLHEYGVTSIATIPESERLLITSHDAFNYFGRAYGLEVHGVQGLSTESEAGLQQINELVDLLVTRRVKSVFVESSVPKKNIQALVEGAQARGHSVSVGAELFSDAMGEPDTYEGTYVGMLDHNITCVTRALGGTAPERGLHGQLSIISQHSPGGASP